MSSIDKLLEQLKTLPSDFKYSELVRILAHFGFQERSRGKTSGSRRSFYRPDGIAIDIHKPHPDGVKVYVLKRVITMLSEIGEINDE